MPAIRTSTPIFALRRSFGDLQHGVLGVARSAGRLGVPVYATRMHAREPAARSKYLRGCLELPAQATDEEWLEALLAFDAGGERPLLFAIDDAGAVFAAEHHGCLAERFVLPATPAGVTRGLASKRELFELCRRLGLPTPASSFPTSGMEAAAHAGAFGYPVVLKRSEPWFAAPEETAPSVLIARTEAELELAYHRMREATRSHVMVQEHIPGPSDSVWMFNGYYAADTECLCAFTGRKLRQHGPHAGATTLGMCSWNGVVAAAADRLMRALGYAGIVDMGFRYDHRDGDYKLLDVNPRLGSTFRLFAGENGIDVLRAAYLDLTGQPVPATHARDGRKWLVEPGDLRASALLAREGELSLARWLSSLGHVDETAWWAGDDRRPFFAMCASYARSGLRSRARRRREADETDEADARGPHAAPLEPSPTA